MATDALYDSGRLEIIPVQAPLTVLVWGVDRVVPVVVSLTITEEAFDPHLRPIRVKVGLECKMLTTNDLPVDHLGRSSWTGSSPVFRSIFMRGFAFGLR